MRSLNEQQINQGTRGVKPALSGRRKTSCAYHSTGCLTGLTFDPERMAGALWVKVPNFYRVQPFQIQSDIRSICNIRCASHHPHPRKHLEPSPTSAKVVWFSQNVNNYHQKEPKAQILSPLWFCLGSQVRIPLSLVLLFSPAFLRLSLGHPETAKCQEKSPVFNLSSVTFIFLPCLQQWHI